MLDQAALNEFVRNSTAAEFRFLPQTGSTNDDALAWAEQGAPDGAVVAADLQTQGRGRQERRWVTAAGSALAFSVIFRPSALDGHLIGLFSGLGGVAVAEALEQGWGLSPEIKWPNDVLVARRKVCGILAESVWRGSQIEALVLGIGVNVAASSVPPPAEILFPAGCVEEAAGCRVNRWELLQRILERLFAWRDQVGRPDLLEAWQKRLAFRNEAVQLRMSDRTLSGELIGIDAAGGLRLRFLDGREEIVLAGDVHLRPAA